MLLGLRRAALYDKKAQALLSKAEDESQKEELFMLSSRRGLKKQVSSASSWGEVEFDLSQPCSSKAASVARPPVGLTRARAMRRTEKTKKIKKRLKKHIKAGKKLSKGW